MTRRAELRRAGITICVCAHIEHRSRDAPCSRCGRGYTKRVTPDRLAALRAVEANPRAAIKDRVVRKACIDLRLLAVVQAAPPNNTGRRRRDPPWELSVTPAGTAVLKAVQAHEVATEQGRHDVAASVVRHVDIALIENSSVGQGLRRIREQGIDAELEHLSEEMADLTPEEDALLREIASAPPRKIGAKS